MTAIVNTHRFGIMFFVDPVAAFANIGRALRPGRRLAFACTRDIDSGVSPSNRPR